MHAYVRLLRPADWVKNVFVFAGLAFGERMREPKAVGLTLIAFATFCLASSVGYIVNDILDRQRDRRHPTKRLRPIASGTISPAAGGALAVLLAGMTVGGSAILLPRPFLASLLGYWTITIVYSLWLKHVMIWDVVTISVLFVLRALAGAVAIDVVVSPWLMSCTFMLCLFLGFGKRRCEIATIGNTEDIRGHRATLSGYTPELLNHLLSTSGGIAIVTFLLYTMDTSPPAPPFPKHYLAYTLPLVVYGIFRYAMLIESGKAIGPTELLISDRPFLLTVLIWGAVAMVIVYKGATLAAWLDGG